VQPYNPFTAGEKYADAFAVIHHVNDEPHERVMVAYTPLLYYIDGVVLEPLSIPHTKSVHGEATTDKPYSAAELAEWHKNNHITHIIRKNDDPISIITNYDTFLRSPYVNIIYQNDQFQLIRVI